MKSECFILPLVLLVLARPSFAGINPTSSLSQNAVASATSSGVYISSYQENDQEDYYEPPYTNDSGYVFPSESWTEINFTHWTDGKGGDGQWMFRDGPDVLQKYTWPATSFPQALPQGTGIYSEPGIPGNQPVTRPCKQPSLMEEHCNITLGKSPHLMPIKTTRTADTKIKLATGGPVGSTKMNLWVISVTATDNTTGAPIAPQNITIYGKTLGSDGNAYLGLPDNATPFDVTPVIAGNIKYYVYTINAAKYNLTITANNNDLSTTTPTFCVGQLVTFAPVWDVNPPILDTLQNWILPGNYVNEQYSYSLTCTAYRNNTSFMANPTTSCWYVDQPGGVVSMWINLHFANGQHASLSRDGNFALYKPTVSGFKTSPPYYAALVPNSSPNELQLGDNSGAGQMQYGLHVNSIAPFGGDANIVQLVNASRSVADTTHGGGQQQTTGGEFWLDNSDPYFSSGIAIFPPSYSNYVLFMDQPGYGLNYIFGAYPVNLCAINDSFKDYIIFKPSGNNSIYITLGRVVWSWSANTSKSTSGWSIPTYQVNGPTALDGSVELPTWPTVLNNSGVGTGN
jgi:hypothetical protein